MVSRSYFLKNSLIQNLFCIPNESLKFKKVNIIHIRAKYHSFRLFRKWQFLFLQYYFLFSKVKYIFWYGFLKIVSTAHEVSNRPASPLCSGMTKNCTNSLLSSILWVVRDAILLFLSNWFHLREEALLVLNFDNDLFCNDVETDKEIAILNSDSRSISIHPPSCCSLIQWLILLVLSLNHQFFSEGVLNYSKQKLDRK